MTLLLRSCMPLMLLSVPIPAGAQPSGSADAKIDDALADEGLRHLQATEAAFARAIERARPSVVSVFLVSPEDGSRFDRNPWRRRNDQDPRDPDSYNFTPTAFGSGIVVDGVGLVLTAYHLVRPATEFSDSDSRLVVFAADGTRRPADVIAADPRSDLAMLRVVADGPLGWQAIEIGAGERLRPGQFVLALGNPFGVAAADGLTSASWGIVSNIRRRPAIDSRYEEERQRPPLYAFSTLVQTDARLNLGISGGALIDVEGRLVGVTMALAAASGSDVPGGFALPADDFLRRVIERMKQGREVEYGFLGIRPVDFPAAGAVERGWPDRSGVLVQDVQRFLPAYYQGGLRNGDVIVSIGGQDVREVADLMIAVGTAPAGSVIDVEVLRSGRTDPLRLRVPLAKFPVEGEIIATAAPESWRGLRVDWVSLLAEPTFSKLEEPPRGVVVTAVAEGSPAAAVDLVERQIVTHVNGQEVTRPEEFYDAVRKADASGDPVRLVVSDGFATTTVEFPSSRDGGRR